MNKYYQVIYSAPTAVILLLMEVLQCLSRGAPSTQRHIFLLQGIVSEAGELLKVKNGKDFVSTVPSLGILHSRL